MENKANKNNKLLMILVGIMGIVTVSVISVAGVMLYKGYASENSGFDDSTEKVVSIDETITNYSYYNDVTEYLTVYVNYVETTYPTIVKGDLTDSEKELALSDTNKFILYSQKFNSTPITYEDNLIDEHFFKFKISAENVADYAKSYLYKNEKVYIDLMKDSFKNTRIHIDTISEIEKEYYK